MSTIGMGMESTEGDVLTADLHGANERVISAWKALFVMADAENEQGIADFAAARIDMHQKWAWQMRSHLGIM
jgi:DNA-binding ferritin-like protein